MMSGPMLSYFGPPHSRKPWEKQIPTPLGGSCVLCDELIDEGDVGEINLVGQITHYECMIRAVVGSLGHQQRRCSCFGGTEDDPPDMTVRQAAIAAEQYHRENHR